jgi:hypothetical protein
MWNDITIVLEANMMENFHKENQNIIFIGIIKLNNYRNNLQRHH